MRKKRIKRIFEILPATLSWLTIFSFILLIIFKPLWAAIGLIVYLLYWFFRLLYMSLLLILAHHRMLSKRGIHWLKLCRNINSDKHLQDIWQIVLYTIYKEPIEVIRDSLISLTKIDYPLDKMIVVLAGEEREKGIQDKLKNLKDNFGDYFKDIIITIHPKDLPGEIAGKGSNATYAARQVKEYLKENNINLEDVLISCFDSDTCVDRQYFSCLAYHFLSNPKRYQVSFQPLPIYSNNIYYAPGFARVIEISSTFWQLIESMRDEKFVTFSSHSMSFKTLVEVDYWPVDMISDDSLIYWKCFVKFDGDYYTYSLDIPVYMDIAVGKNFFDTLAVQYKQKRRWAFGIEAFVFLGLSFLKKNKIPLSLKIRKLFQVLDSHINWATWSIIVSFLVPFVFLWTVLNGKEELVFYNLSYINRIIWHMLTFILFICMIISKEFIPPRPKQVSRLVYLSFVWQWFLTPLISALLGSFPALDAQTRMMFRREFRFYPTPKKREEIESIAISALLKKKSVSILKS